MREARRLIDEYGVRGFKFHPNTQGFFPNDRLAYPLYEVDRRAGPAGAVPHRPDRRRRRARAAAAASGSKYSNPMYLDDVAVDFPDMPIILAHPSFPWQDEALAVATHKPQVYIDLSGWSPKYFPPHPRAVRQHAAEGQGAVRLGLPGDHPDRWMADFETAEIRDEVRPLILKDNAARLLGLKGAAEAR